MDPSLETSAAYHIVIETKASHEVILFFRGYCNVNKPTLYYLLSTTIQWDDYLGSRQMPKYIQPNAEHFKASVLNLMKDYLTIFINTNLHTKSFKHIMLFHVEIKLLKFWDPICPRNVM